MKTVKTLKGNAHGLAAATRNHLVLVAVLGVATPALAVDSIYQSGGSGTTYTDELGDQQGSANALRDISFATISNDANNLYITLGISPTGNLATGGSFNYIIGITTGSPTAGGDISTSSTHGNAYGRDISFDSGFGGMTDFIGVFGAPSNGGSVGTPYTSYGFNDYVFGTPNNTTTASGVWTKINTVSSGEALSDQPSTSIPNQISLTIPLANFADNLALTPGTTIDFDIDSTGTSGTQSAYDSLATQGPTQGTFNATNQFNETVLDSYTITATPEPGACALAVLGGAGLLLARFRNRKA
jgi:hypothetical protein